MKVQCFCKIFGNINLLIYYWKRKTLKELISAVSDLGTFLH